MNIGTWNVKTLLKPGKLQELKEQLDKTTLDVVAVQETRWSNTEIIKKKDFTFYYGGPKTRTGQAGTGFFIRTKVMNYVIGFETYNERISKLRIKGKYNNVTLINVYAPTEEYQDNIKEQFYDDLQYVVDHIPRSDTTIILGDLNAQLGKEACFGNVTGKHTLHEITNQNGEYLCQFVTENDMIVMSTQFQHKKIHKGTWMSPDNNTITQIDHVIIKNSKKEIIEDVKTMRGPNVDSDHYLVKFVINQKLPRIYYKKHDKTKKWNNSNLKNLHTLKQYRLSLHSKLNAQPKNEDIEIEWENIKTAMIDAAQNTIQYQSDQPKNEWRDEECKQIIKLKNDARMKVLRCKTRTSQEAYVQIRNQANKLCRQKKKKWLNNKIIQIEESRKRNESRKFFRDIKNFQQSHKSIPTICKDADGNILTHSEQVLTRWKEYFCEVLNDFENNNDFSSQAICGDKHKSDNEDVQPPSFNEINYIINNLKGNKAAGSDNIPGELFKHGGRTLKHRMHALIIDLWNKEKIPEQWTEGLIYPIHKKGDGLVCSNYRPITLLNIAYKILAILLNNRLTAIVESQLQDYQMGFRPDRSTIDNIFIVKQMFEKCHEYNINLYNIFVDYTHAFDSVSREKIIECLMQYKVPSKLIHLIGLTLCKTTAQIKIGNILSDKFNINCGVKQGDPLSATLFSLVIDQIIKKLDMRGNISTKSKQSIAYADDILLTARSKQSAIEILEKLKECSLHYGLVINTKKNKILKVFQK
ncbi:hypothetical protein C0J52_19674 [Blattella germanica]|nr:hypothetical protein C0J52_19674 [Blattella germanica]